MTIKGFMADKLARTDKVYLFAVKIHQGITAITRCIPSS